MSGSTSCAKCGTALPEYLEKLLAKGKIGPFCDSCAFKMDQEKNKEWTKFAGMKQEGWWWIDTQGKLGRKGAKYTKGFDGSPAAVNENKTYI